MILHAQANEPPYNCPTHMCNGTTVGINLLSVRPPIFSMQKVRRSAQGLEVSGEDYSSGVYYSDFQLPGESARYVIYIVTLV